MDLLWALYFYFMRPVLTLLFFVFIAWVIVGWLVAFGVINQSNPNARAVIRFLDRICEPMCAPFRKIIPNLGGLDLSPLAVVLLIGFVRDWVLPTIIRMLAGGPGVGYL